jgi:hypothetical protein
MEERVDLKGWGSWISRRRRQLRKSSMLDLSGCSQLAIYEARCRARIGLALGKSFAKSVRLQPCDGGNYTEDRFAFILLHPVSRETWQKIRKIPGLLQPIAGASQLLN